MDLVYSTAWMVATMQTLQDLHSKYSRKFQDLQSLTLKSINWIHVKKFQDVSKGRNVAWTLCG